MTSLASRRTLTIAEAATELGIGTRLAYELARRGEIPARRLGTRWVVPVAALDEFLGLATDAEPSR